MLQNYIDFDNDCQYQKLGIISFLIVNNVIS